MGGADFGVKFMVLCAGAEFEYMDTASGKRPKQRRSADTTHVYNVAE